jgi:hypothetical protein
MVIEMDRVPPQPVKDPPNLVRVGSFSRERLLSHVDPGTTKESEDFVRRSMSSATLTSPPTATERLVVDTVAMPRQVTLGTRAVQVLQTAFTGPIAT